MPHFDPLDWARKLDEIDDIRSLREAANAIAASAGLPLYCYAQVGNRFRRNEYTLYGNFSADWLAARYLHLPKAGADDPVVRHVTRGLPPVCWSQRGQVLGPHEPSSATRKLLGAAGSFGMRAGITVPLLSPGARWSFMTFATSDTSDARDLVEVLLGATYFAALLRCTYDRLRPRPEITLSDRQSQILGFFSSGQSARSIADRLHISTRTVYTHVENAAVRMRVPQRDAVEAARCLGLISAD